MIQEYQGRQRYAAEFRVGPDRLLVSLTCFVADHADFVPALLDTAAEWNVLSASLVHKLGLAEELAYPERLETRLGTFWGRIERLPLRFPATDGEDLTVQATWFVCPEWPGPVVLGWKGCLERFRFAMDPHEEHFYFGA